MEAETVDALCQRYGCLPSQLKRETVEILRLQTILGEANG